MIISQLAPQVSTIFLTIVLIIYLIIIELGSSKIRRSLLPFVYILTITFFIMATKTVYLTYISIK